MCFYRITNFSILTWHYKHISRPYSSYETSYNIILYMTTVISTLLVHMAVRCQYCQPEFRSKKFSILITNWTTTGTPARERAAFQFLYYRFVFWYWIFPFFLGKKWKTKMSSTSSRVLPKVNRIFSVCTSVSSSSVLRLCFTWKCTAGVWKHSKYSLFTNCPCVNYSTNAWVVALVYRATW